MKTIYTRKLNSDDLISIVRNYFNIPKATITMSLTSDEDITYPWELEMIIIEEAEKSL